MVKPYTDTYYTNYHIREFDTSIPDNSLVWHQDHNNRQITILNGNNWMIQFDNTLPQLLEIGKTYYIPKLLYHRLIKGSSPLHIKIIESF